MDFAKNVPPRGGLMRPTLFDDQGEVLELPSAWLRSLVISPKNNSPKTIETYANNLKYFCDYLACIDSWGVASIEVVLASISTSEIGRYFRYLQKFGLSDATVRNREATLREFFRGLQQREQGM
jgi:site-specific recombinase XerD